MVYHLSVFIFVIIFLSLGTEIETPVSDLAGWAKTFILILIVCFFIIPPIGARFRKKSKSIRKKMLFFITNFNSIFHPAKDRGLVLIVILNSP